MRRVAQIVLGAVVLLPILAAGAGMLIGGGVLHPQRRSLTAIQIQQADQVFMRIGAIRDEFEVRAADGVVLRGWKVRPPKANGDWVLLFHGVSDNRIGVLGHAEFLLRNGYSVLMMDARAHGVSDGSLATYGWLERHDTRAIAEALNQSESVHCLFALGESMGAALALQSAAIEPRIDGVVAESSFSDLREVAYDYAGLHLSPWLGKTLFRPAVWTAIRQVEKEGGFQADEISPEKAVAQRGFPVLLICGELDRNIPARHSERIYTAARGVKQLWLVPGAGHSAAPGTAPREFEQRVVNFLREIHEAQARRARNEGGRN